jgi:hypothetical protein
MCPNPPPKTPKAMAHCIIAFIAAESILIFCVSEALPWAEFLLGPYRELIVKVVT